MEITLHTNIPFYRCISQDLRKGGADLFAIQRAFSDMILGADDAFVPGVDRKEGHIAPNVGLLTVGGDNNRPLDAAEVNKILHSDPNILQPSEVVEMAFRGRRDMLIFTTRRLIAVDPKGIAGKSVEYLSIPWTSILAYAVQTAGKILDLDAEMAIYTDIMFKPAEGEDNPAEPAMSKLEYDFNKGLVNILDIQRYLSYRCLAMERNIKIPTNMITAAPSEAGLDSLISRWGDDMKAIDSQEVNREFHTTAPILLDGEDIVMAFKAGRDMTLFTNKRVLHINTTGFTGKKKTYLSIPYKSIRGFAIESAGR
jgi:Bacterial PH domain